MARMSKISLALAVCAMSLWTALAARANESDVHTEPHGPARRVCLPPNETREEIKQRHFHEPFAILKSAAAQFKAEALSAKLCRFSDEFVYEITLLRRDGRLVHVVMSATTGKLVGSRNAHEPMPKM
jgi:uncharacterized membrane protein YkoI